MNCDSGLDQRVDEFGRGQEVRLIRRDDEAARVSQFRFAQHLVILYRDAAAEPAAASAAGVRLRVIRLRPALAALPAITIDRGLDLGDAARIDRPIVPAP